MSHDDLACNAAAAAAAGGSSSSSLLRKRMREAHIDMSMMMMLPPQSNRDRLHCSAAASTSYDSDIDALISLHIEKIRSGSEEMSKEHCREALSAVDKLMIEKEAELETAKKKNAELEASTEQVAAAKQTWIDFAKNSEAVARGLKADLDRVLLLRTAGGDAESCCYFEGPPDRTSRRRRRRSRFHPCRACRRRGASVLLLPCRHLCLCRACEPAADACPICHLEKNGVLQVFVE